MAAAHDLPSKKRIYATGQRTRDIPASATIAARRRSANAPPRALTFELLAFAVTLRGGEALLRGEHLIDSQRPSQA